MADSESTDIGVQDREITVWGCHRVGPALIQAFLMQRKHHHYPDAWHLGHWEASYDVESQQENGGRWI